MKVSRSLIWILLFANLHSIALSQDPCDNIISISGVNVPQTYTTDVPNSGWLNNFCQGTLFASGATQIYSFVPSSTGYYSIELLASDGHVTYGWQPSACDISGWHCLLVGSTPGTYGMMEWNAGTTYYLLLDATDASTQQFQIIHSDDQACPDAYESNNTQGTATTSVFNTLNSSYYNQTAYGTIHEPLDEDFYRLFINEEGTLNLSLPYIPAQYDMQLINVSGEVVAYWTWMGGGTVSYTAGAIGPYYIRVYVDGRRSGVYSCTPYELNLEWIPSYLDVSPNSNSVSSSAGSTSFTVSASEDWDVSDDVTWLTATEASSTSISVNYDANTSSSQRTANITVTTTGGLTETVTVYQSGAVISCEDDYEPNETWGTANTSAIPTLGSSNYNSSISGTIHDATDDDYFRINLSAVGTLYMRIPDPPVDYDLEILNSAGTQVGLSGASGSEFLTYDITTASTGYYYIHIYGYNGANSCTPYTLNLEWIASYLDVAPNSREVSSTAGSTSFSVNTDLEWDVSDDATWLSATEASTTSINVNYDANTSSSQRTAYITVTTSRGLTETVTVIQDPTSGTCEDNYESNNTQGTAYTSAFPTLGTSIHESSIPGTIHDASDEDYYRVNISVAGTLHLRMLNPPADYSIELLNAAGQQVAYSINPGNEYLNYDIISSSTGYYYFRIYGANGANSCSIYYLDLGWDPFYLDVTPDSRAVSHTAGSHNFTVSSNLEWTVDDDVSWLSAIKTSTTNIDVNYDANTGSSSRTANITVTTPEGLSETVTVVQGAEPVGCEDDYEANNTLGTATVSAFGTLDNSYHSSSISGTIHDASDEDYYRINLAVPGFLNLSLPNPPADYNLELLNAAGQQVAFSGTSGSESLSYEITSATIGYYYIGIDGGNGAYSCTEYDLNLEWTPYYLDITPGSLEVGPESGTANFVINTNTDWNVEDDVTWLAVSKTSNTAFDASYDANTTSSIRTAHIRIWSTQGLEEIVTIIQNYSSDNPNLKPIKLGGWDYEFIISSAAGTHQDDDIVVGETAYIDYAWTNNGTADAGAHSSCIYLNNQIIDCVDFESFQEGFLYYQEDWEYTFTESGWHTLKVVLDVDNEVYESNEGDNEYEREIYVGPATEIKNYAISDHIKVYPNPTTGKINLEISQAQEKVYMIEIIDPTGRSLWNQEIETLKSNLTVNIDLSEKSAGLYFLNVSNSSGTSVKKIVLRD